MKKGSLRSLVILVLSRLSSDLLHLLLSAIKTDTRSKTLFEKKIEGGYNIGVEASHCTTAPLVRVSSRTLVTVATEIAHTKILK